MNKNEQSNCTNIYLENLRFFVKYILLYCCITQCAVTKQKARNLCVNYPLRRYVFHVTCETRTM